MLVSRGQLVEIGGGFRIPDVLRQSGATLVEVGTTNRTHLRDFEEALAPTDGRDHAHPQQQLSPDRIRDGADAGGDGARGARVRA